MSNQMDNNANKKEEILEKSRKLKQDEGMEYVQKQGVSIGSFIAFILVCALSVISALADQMNTVWALGAVSSAFWFGKVFANYRFTKKKPYLLKTICAAFVLIAFVYWFIATVQGW
jgi:hypothetical protein